MFFEHYSQVPESVWRWKNFTPKEIASHTLVQRADGVVIRGPKGPILINENALDKLQELRDRWGKPIVVSSAYRHPDYNSWVGGARRSKHMEGIAFDSPKKLEEFDDYVSLAIEVGFKGIGYYNTFIHVDTRDTSSVVTWDNRR